MPDKLPERAASGGPLHGGYAAAPLHRSSTGPFIPFLQDDAFHPLPAIPPTLASLPPMHVQLPGASLRDRATLPSPQAVSALRAGIPRASVRFADCALRLPGGSLRSPPSAWPPPSCYAPAYGFSRHRVRRSRCLAGPGRLRRHRAAPRLTGVRIRERRLARAAPRHGRSRAAAARLRFRFRNRSPRRSVPWVGSSLRPSAGSALTPHAAGCTLHHVTHWYRCRHYSFSCRAGKSSINLTVPISQIECYSKCLFLRSFYLIVQLSPMRPLRSDRYHDPRSFNCTQLEPSIDGRFESSSVSRSGASSSEY